MRECTVRWLCRIGLHRWLFERALVDEHGSPVGCVEVCGDCGLERLV